MHFHYLSSAWLFSGVVFLAFLYSWSGFRRRQELIKLGDWRLIKTLIPVEALLRRKKKDFLAFLSFLFLLFAALGPQFGTKLKEIQHQGVDVFIAVDTS